VYAKYYPRPLIVCGLWNRQYCRKVFALKITFKFRMKYSCLLTCLRSEIYDNTSAVTNLPLSPCKGGAPLVIPFSIFGGQECTRPSFENITRRLNMESDLQSLFGLHVHTAQLYSLAEAPHLGSYSRALLVSQDRRYLYLTHRYEVFLLPNVFTSAVTKFSAVLMQRRSALMYF
jgi:hypothetical protein